MHCLFLKVVSLSRQSSEIDPNEYAEYDHLLSQPPSQQDVLNSKIFSRVLQGTVRENVEQELLVEPIELGSINESVASSIERHINNDQYALLHSKCSIESTQLENVDPDFIGVTKEFVANEFKCTESIAPMELPQLIIDPSEDLINNSNQTSPYLPHMSESKVSTASRLSYVRRSLETEFVRKEFDVSSAPSDSESVETTD